MPEFSTRRRVAFTPAEMYALVADVERYPEFLPLCEALRVRSRETVGDRSVLVATMDVGYGPVRESFTSRVTLDPTVPAVDADHVDGPFRTMHNRWRFHALPGGGTEVEFFVRYEFKSVMLQMLVGSLFESAFRRFAEAFEARAAAIYGPAERRAPTT
jgi:coenzyme Q-binding protein COQ10